MRIKKIQILVILLCTIFFGISFLYYEYFSEFLTNDQFTNANGFTRIVIPDTFSYKNIIDDELIIQSILFSSLKNTIGPSFIWVITSNNWVLVSFLNTVFVFFTLRYLIKITNELKLPVHKSYYLIIIIVALPTTLYFSIGALKEIPCLFALTGFFYNFIKKKTAASIFFLFFLIVFRYQFAFPLFFFIILDRFKKKSLSISLLFLCCIAFFYPLLELDVFSKDAIVFFRESNEGSIGAIVENVRSNILGLSLFAVAFRNFQSIFEPILVFLKAPNFYDEGNINIYGLCQFLSVVVLIKYWLQFFVGFINVIRNPKFYDRNIVRLYTLCILVIIPTAGFSFIQHRYLYPVTGLMILSVMSTSEKRRTIGSKGNNVIPNIPVLPA